MKKIIEQIFYNFRENFEEENKVQAKRHPRVKRNISENKRAPWDLFTKDTAIYIT